MYNSVPNELRMLTKHLKHPVKLRWHWRQLIKPSNQSSPWKINVEPENGGLEDDFPFNWVILRPLLIFRGVYGFPELYVTHFNQIFNCHLSIDTTDVRKCKTHDASFNVKTRALGQEVWNLIVPRPWQISSSRHSPFTPDKQDIVQRENCYNLQQSMFNLDLDN